MYPKNVRDNIATDVLRQIARRWKMNELNETLVRRFWKVFRKSNAVNTAA